MLREKTLNETINAPVVEVFDNVAVVRAQGQEPVGFHIRNLEVAGLSDEATKALRLLNGTVPSSSLAQSSQIKEISEAAEQLKAWNESVNPDVKPGTIKFGPRSITINVTQICNLHCTYCAAGGDGTFGDPVKKISVEKTLPQLKSFLEMVPEGKNFHITFLGGEPLLYPEGIRLISEYTQAIARERGIRISLKVVTNGTRFTEENIQLLCDIKADLTISLDGPAEVNDVTRPSAGGRGMTSLIEAGIQSLLKRKSELGQVEISGVFGKQNPNLMAAYEFYRSFDVDQFDFTYDHTEISPEISEQFTHDLIEVAKIAYAHGGETELRKITTFNHIFDLLDRQQRVDNFCGAGKSYFMIDARNKIYTCPWVAGQAEEVVGHGSDIWMDKLKPYESSLVELNNCQSCWAKSLCGGGCMYIHKNRTGSKNKKDDNFCKRTRSLLAQAIVYYKQSRSSEADAERVAK